MSCEARSGRPYGTRLIKLELTHELQGKIETAYEEPGFRAFMSFPTSPRCASNEPQTEAAIA